MVNVILRSSRWFQDGWHCLDFNRLDDSCSQSGVGHPYQQAQRFDKDSKVHIEVGFHPIRSRRQKIKLKRISLELESNGIHLAGFWSCSGDIVPFFLMTSSFQERNVHSKLVPPLCLRSKYGLTSSSQEGDSPPDEFYFKSYPDSILIIVDKIFEF